MKDAKISVSLIVVEWLVLVFTGCPISTESKCITTNWTEYQTLPIGNSDGFALKLLFKREAAPRGGSDFKEVCP